MGASRGRCTFRSLGVAAFTNSEKIVEDFPMKSQIFFVALAVLGASTLLVGQQNDGPSAFDKCRIVTTTDLTDKHAPAFDTYPVTSAKAVEKPKLDLASNPVARMYRTTLRHEIGQGPNFAGHYRVALWGCGSSCSEFAVVNLSTGRVITPEGFSHTSGVFFEFEGDSQKLFPGIAEDHWLLGFKNDSRLLVVLGDLDEDESREGAFYFLLENERLRLIHSTRVKKNCENLRDHR